nr:glycosyltransferase [Marinobacter bryozoorum]
MGIGGTEQVIRQLVTGLPSDCYENHVVCIDGNVGEMGQQLQRDGVDVFSISREAGIDKRLIRAIRESIRQLGVDIVHCHQYTPWFYGWLASLGTSARVVFTEHGRFHPDRYRHKAFALNPLMALKTHAIVAISDATRSALSRYEFVPKSRIQVLYNGIRSIEKNPSRASEVRAELGIPDKDFVLGTIARLDPVKNQAMMLDGFSIVLESCPDSWLLMVGDGPDRRTLERRASELGIESRVCFTGFREEPADYLAAMDLFLLTSHTEGTSMTLLEAMSLGVPAIATAVGGNVEIVESGRTGLLIPTENPAELAKAVLRLKSDRDLREKLGRESRILFEERFSVARMVSRYQDLYVKVLED